MSLSPPSSSSPRASIQNLAHYVTPPVRPAATRRSPQARSPRRRRSRCSAPTAAASSTSTRPTRSRTRTADQLRRDGPRPDDPGRPGDHLRKAGPSRRQGYAILATMFVLFVAGVAVAYAAEAHGRPQARRRPAHAGSRRVTGGNLRGQGAALRDRVVGALHVVTTVTRAGRSNSSLESYTGLGATVPFANLSASEVIFGGVGTGLYSMLLYVLLAVFIGGLMVGRTPELAGQEDRARVYDQAGPLGLLVTPLSALLSTALASADARRPGVDLGQRDRPGGVLGDVLRIPLRKPRTTGRPSPATRATSNRPRQPRRPRCHASPTSSAAPR